MIIRDMDRLRRRLFEAAADSANWPTLLADISVETASSGAVLLSVDKRLSHTPSSDGLQGLSHSYFNDGWSALDERYGGVPTMLEQGVTSEFDFTDPARMSRSAFYEDFLAQHNCRWFAGVGFLAGSDLWCLAIQRSPAEGPFQAAELEELKALWRPFSDAATMSRMIDRHRIETLTWGLDAVPHGAIVLSQRGQVAHVNQAARLLLGPMLGSGSELKFRDAASRSSYDALVANALKDTARSGATTLSTIVAAADRGHLLIRAIAFPSKLGTVFEDASVMLLIKKHRQPLETILAQDFGLTRAEVDIASALAAGRSLTEIGIRRAVRPDTIRTQLKRIFSKTNTTRQSQLVAFVNRLSVAEGPED